MLPQLQQFLTRLETVLVGTCIVLLLGITLGQIVARNFFDTGIPAADTLSRLLLLYITFLGAALAICSDRHIKVDVIAHWLPQTWRDRLYRPLFSVGAVVCLLFTIAAVRFWLDAWEFAPEHERWLVILDAGLPAGFALLTLHFLCCVSCGPYRRAQIACTTC